MAQVNLGRIGFVNKGSWNSVTNYKLNDVVKYGGSTYAAKRPNVGITPPTNGTDTDDWFYFVNISDYVDKTSNQDITGIKNFTKSPIVPTPTANTQAANKEYIDNNFVKLTGDQTIAGYKTFSSPISGNFIGSIQFSGSTGNAYYHSNIMVNGNGDTNTIKPSIGFHQPGLYAGTLSMLDGNTFQFQNQSGQPATLSNHITGNAGSATYAAAFTTAVGSAPSYACRAWVNFNGTGTVAIRGSGNVSSITDRGVGQYTINFTTAMVDSNYSASCAGENTTRQGFYSPKDATIDISASFYPILTAGNQGLFDPAFVQVSIFR